MYVAAGQRGGGRDVLKKIALHNSANFILDTKKSVIG
jgi:hypothetical protein